MKNHVLFVLLIVGLLIFNSCQPSQTSSKSSPAPVDSLSQEPHNNNTTSNLDTTLVEPIPSPTTPPSVQPKGVTDLPCSSPDFNLVKAVNEAAIILTGTPYSRPNKTDCSGMYHKVLDELRKSCPEALMPKINQARSSRDLAVWYHQKGVLQIVKDPETMMDWIQPGSVMFYGYGSRLGKYNAQNLVIDSLMVRGIGINHVSIITTVERDDQGLVTSYEMFHGRNPKYPAGVTTSRRVYQNRPTLPMYGNWKETWVGVVKVPMVGG